MTGVPTFKGRGRIKYFNWAEFYGNIFDKLLKSWILGNTFLVNTFLVNRNYSSWVEILKSNDSVKKQNNFCVVCSTFVERLRPWSTNPNDASFKSHFYCKVDSVVDVISPFEFFICSVMDWHHTSVKMQCSGNLNSINFRVLGLLTLNIVLGFYILKMTTQSCSTKFNVSVKKSAAWLS